MYLCADYVERPVIRGEALGVAGSWVRVHFLVDTGADRTVFGAHILATLGLSADGPAQQFGGVGGLAQAVPLDTMIRLVTEGDGRARFPGPFSVMTDRVSLDMSLLGRDILDFFAVIVDRPGNTVCLVNQRHRYTVSVG